MPDLTEFLLARIAEDEAVAEAAKEPADTWRFDLDAKDRAAFDHIIRHDPARVLAECEAKRRRLAAFDKLEGEADGDEWRWISNTIARLLAIEALPYADHPDYREEWRA